ncbi:VOC family protein [Xanthomonas sp. A2111]|uniref:VOC family protein n=1 Tax=Xanthomonas hawaiiensis TaxID=3003247 RepID=A0ABU2IBL2_9XANT|nr:VOC family protein [Xanthomonas sp. A2111]MBO9830634.1 VOC family protein [Xanthomonas sp. A2111]MDS9995157.1 VOC family protein [Xanthomonas sp. A2111]
MNTADSPTEGVRDTESDIHPSVLAKAIPFRRIDHIALAVVDLEEAIVLFRDVLGFELTHRRHIAGKLSGMVSAEMEGNGMRFVLCQGTEPESQVAQLIRNFGPGVAHIALEVEEVDSTVNQLRSRGLSFDTPVIRGPGLTQAFSSRCKNSGMSFEIIHREGEDGFLDSNVQSLFDQLEQSGKY